MTFTVPGDWTVPDLSSITPRSENAGTIDLTATYFDTEDGTLRRLGVTLRRRTGGNDDGWHLKVPAGAARTEVHSQARGQTVPDSLARRVDGVVGGRALRPVAIIATARRTTVLRDDSGAVVAEIADDAVSTTTLGRMSILDGWREVEVELGPAGTEQHLTMITRLFRRSGALVSAAQVKLIRAFGALELPQPDDEVTRAAVAYVRKQCRAILLGDIALRHKATGRTVHQTRVAIRRLRSALRTLAPVLDSGEAADTDAPTQLSLLDDDLSWLAALLGQIRDGDVVSRRLLDEIAELPPELVLGPIVREISATAAADRRAALDHLRRGRADDRYGRALATLASWYADVPVSDIVLEPTKIISATRRQVERRLAKAGHDVSRLHRARKAAKRLRYTAEAFTPVLSKASKIGNRAKRIQTSLGDHQDLVVAAGYLRRLATEHSASDAHNGFTYGLLHANAEHRAAAIRTRLRH